MSDYFTLPNCIDLDDDGELKFKRSISIRTAIRADRDFAFISAAIIQQNDAVVSEIIYVDVECDEVPPLNSVGIEFRERLAILIPQNQQELIEVYALRKAFPVTAHQNAHIRGFPLSLCLYYEPAMSVVRSWTAQKFLRRIQWWLEKSAVNALHANDQPTENLFFVTPYELILPWNFNQHHTENASSFSLGCGETRFDNCITFFLEKSVDVQGGKLANIVVIDLPPVVHGNIERPSETLGQLAETLGNRKVDLIQRLKTEISKQVPPLGIEKSKDTDRTVIILHIPLCRAQDAAPDYIQHKAFVLLQGILKLGEELDCLLLMAGKYQNVFTPSAKHAWKTIDLFPLDVRYRNDIRAFKDQSGTSGTDPRVVLVGAGALGSNMLNLWARAGWGHWLIIDKDHIKPHNLSRHIAFAQHVGVSKADCVAQLYRCVLDGARDIVSISADATELSSPKIQDALSSGDLVIDASTTLEYPRLASRMDGLPRHFSVFITPNGKSSVLLAEDVHRKIRLRTLEAQYYRALIQQPWGEKHLEGNISTFWSGASCRDISTVLSYTHVTAHAATLAAKCQQVSQQEAARICLWTHDHDNGGVVVSTVEVHPETLIVAGGFTVSIDEGVRQQLFEMRRNALPNETGGVILGYYDFTINSLIIVCGLGAPKDSVSTPVSFVRGSEGLLEEVSDASRRTAGVVDYVGEWHSHPDGCSVKQSNDDIGQIDYLTKKMADDGLPAVQIIVGENELSINISPLHNSNSNLFKYE